MHIVVIGGTGFVGRGVLQACFEEYKKDLKLTLVTRRKDGAEFLPAWVKPFVWDVSEAPPTPVLMNKVDVVVNLAGATLAQRWTQKAKQLIRDSRIFSTRNIVEAMRQAPTPPKVFVNASAIGYYGDRGDEELTEQSIQGNGFLSKICQLWEEEAMQAESLGVRVITMRFGIVLGSDGGALNSMLPPFEWGFGGWLGNGQQWISWIHRADAANLVLHSINNEQIRKHVNAVAPNPIRQRDFTRTLAKVVGKPALFPVPAFMLKLMFGEMASVLLESQRAVPKLALSTGYRFLFPELEPALRHLLFWRREWQRR